MSRADSCATLQSHEPGLRSPEVAQREQDRPVFHAEIGDRLKGWREKKGWSVQRAINASAARHGKVLTPNKLRWLEEGKAKMPDSDVLRAVADIYGQSYEELATYFIGASYGSDLLRHSGTGQQGKTSKGVPDVLTTARRRIAELEGEIHELRIYKSIVERIRPLLTDTLTALGAEDDQATGGATKSSRSHRRADR